MCQYEVLKYLSFAASTLAKCAKIIPVMCWGRLILNKRYSAADFVSAFVVTAGCFIFVLDRGMLADRDPSHQSPWVGNANSTLGVGHGLGGDPGWRWHEHRESRLHDYGAMKDPVDATLAATVPGGSAAGDVQLARLGEDPARLGEDPFEAITPNKFVDSLLPRGQLPAGARRGDHGGVTLRRVHVDVPADALPPVQHQHPEPDFLHHVFLIVHVHCVALNHRPGPA